MSWYELPTRREDGENRSVDEVQVQSLQPHPAPCEGAIAQGWEMVKERPFESLFLSFLSLIFSQGGGSNSFMRIPEFIKGISDGMKQGDTGYEATSYLVGTFDGISSWALATPVIGEAFLWIGVFLGVMGFFMLIGLVMWIIATMINGGATIFWLRHVRGQDASLNHTVRVTHFLVPLLFTSVLHGLALAGGFILLIIPGIILWLGFSFVTHVVIDKNLHYVDALKASWRLTDGYKVDLFIFFIFCGLLNFAGFLMCCVGMVVTNAIVMGATALVYNRLTEPGNAYVGHQEIVSVFE